MVSISRLGSSLLYARREDSLAPPVVSFSGELRATYPDEMEQDSWIMTTHYLAAPIRLSKLPP